jgi:hypothetical protein
MTQVRIPTSYDHVPCYSHDHALYPSLVVAAGLTSPVVGLHLVAAGPSAEGEEVLGSQQRE